MKHFSLMKWVRSLFLRRPVRATKARRQRQLLSLEPLECRITPTNLSGAITANATWSGDYTVVGNVDIDAGVTVTIQAGTVIQFNNSTSLTVDGTLVSQGTSSQQVFMTSYRDNSPLGGSNGASRGDWSSLVFNSDSTANVLTYTKVTYGGESGAAGEIVDAGAPLTFDNGLIGSSNVSGMRVTAANPTLAGDAFSNNNGAAVSMDLASDPAITSPTLTNNSINGVELDTGTLSGSVTWNNPAIVYWLPGNVTVPQGDTLTIAAGQVVKLAYGNNNLIVNGTLTAQGTAAEPIVFTSFRDDSHGGNTDNDGSGTNAGSNGDWESIQLSGTAADAMTYVDVLYSGGWGDAAAVIDAGAPLTFDNGVIGSSYVAGMRIVTADPTLNGDTFQNNSGAAVSMDLASDPAITSPTLTNNSINGVELDTGTLSGSVTWNNPAIVYWLPGNVTVPQGDTLTIAAGQVVKLAYGNNNLIVNGTLTAQGTAAEPIVFTSFRDDSHGGNTDNDGSGTNAGSNGDWESIQLSGTAADAMTYVDVLYSGGWGDAAAVIDAGAPLTFDNGVIGSSYVAGMRIVTADPTLNGDTFQNNSGAAVSMDLASDPAITSPTLTNNSINGVELDTGTLSGSIAWNNPAIVYWLQGDVTVPQGDTLTIAAGQVVKLAYGNNNLIVNGTLTAQGTAAEPIVFTSFRDDSHGGNTDNDGSGTNAGSNGDWESIQLSGTAADAMTYVDVLYSGGWGDAAAVIDTGAPLTFDNGVIANSYVAGMRIATANPTLNGDTFQNNSGAGASMDFSSQPIISNATFTNNSINGVALDGGTLASDLSVTGVGAIYSLSSNLTVPQGLTITIGEGATLLYGNSGELDGAGTIDNAGTFLLTRGMYLYPQLVNSGTLNLQNYNLYLNGGMTAEGQGSITGAPGATLNVTGALDGTIDVAADASIAVNGGTMTDDVLNVGTGATFTLNNMTLSGTTTFNLQGTVALTGTTTLGGTMSGTGNGTLQLNDNLDPAVGGVTFNFPGNELQWIGGDFFAHNGNVTNLGTITLASSADMGFFEDATFYNVGTMIQTGTGKLDLHSDNNAPTTLIIEPGASYIIDSNSGINNDNGGQVAVDNEGLIETTGNSTLYINGPLNNTGNIEADGGTLTLQPNSITQLTGSTLTGGTWGALSGATLEFPSGTSITTNAGSLAVSGNGAAIDGITGLADNSGSFSVGGGASFTTAGSITNSGSLTIGGGLSVTGQFVETTGSSVTEQLGGSAAGEYGQIAASGAATLAGAYALALVSGFTPSTGQTFTAMTFGSESGIFSSVSLGSDIVESLNATSLVLTSEVLKQSNLAVTSVTAPTTATGGQSVTVKWQVTNEGSNAATGNWQDSVYLSTTPTITSTSILLGSEQFQQSAPQDDGTLAANASYQGSLTAALPALAPGDYYVLVTADSLYQENDSNRTNGTLAATTGELAVSVPALTPGSPLSSSFTSAGQDEDYQITVSSGGSLTVALTSTAASGSTALYVSQGVQPTPYNAQYSADIADRPNQTLTVPQVLTAGTYYVLAEAISGAAATAAFTLTATQSSDLSISAISSYAGGNKGNVTVEIDGANFTPQLTASLTLGGSTIDSSANYFISASQVYATFDLSGASVGNYALAVKQGTESATAPTTFQVVAANGGAISVNASAPQYVRPGRPGSVVISYINNSNDDLVAPLLDLSSTNSQVQFAAPGNPNDFYTSAQVLAVATTGPSGILRPGQGGQITLSVLSDDTHNGDQLPITVSLIESGQTIDWSSQEAALQSNFVSAAAGTVIWNNLMGMVGTTTDSYNAALAAAATYLGEVGEPAALISDVQILWGFLLNQADATYPAGQLSSATDASLPTPGSLSLALDRTFSSSISARYQPGMFGLGWSTSWQNYLSVDGSGNVTMSMGGEFLLQPNGTYQTLVGEDGTLTATGGGYTYTSGNGTQYVYPLASGLLGYEQDTDGNRITLGYDTQNQLVSLTYSNPNDPTEPTEQLSLTYNSEGFVSQVADGTGNVWTYSYDSVGHLLSVTDPGGFTTSYEYDTAINGETTNALLGITFPDGSQESLTYNATTGQLTGTAETGGADAATYSYPGEGEVEVSNAAGQSITWYTITGAPAMVENALGGVSTYQYDINGNLVAYTDPTGGTYQYTYDSQGDLTSTTNPLGQTTTMDYGPLDTLTAVTDAAGNTTQYGYNSAGNLQSITYPDGTTQTTTYDPLGDPIGTVDQAGNAVSYQYNAAGLLAAETFADGTSEAFSYDAHGDMLTAESYAADGTLTGTTTLTYDSAEELTSIAYPGGLSLTYTYNAQGQRTQSVDQGGYTINYQYSSMGLLSGLTDGSGNSIVTYTYNGVGELVAKKNGNGTYTTYAYDADGNLTKEVNYANSAGTTVNSSLIYTYNPQNEMTSSTDASGNTTTYAYDAAGELTQVILPGGGGTISYSYNAAGDRTEVVTTGVGATYTSNADNEITAVGATTYTYDDNGNLATSTDASGTTTYTYNSLDQLTSITAPDGMTTTFQYNPIGFMTGENVGGTQTNYLVDPTGMYSVVGAYSGTGSLIADYTYGVSLVDTTGPSGTGYYDFNGSGDTIGISGSSGSYVNQYSYLPFGETTTESSALPNPFTYAGQVGVMQIGTNLFDMRARVYTPATGQFLSNDPTGLEGQDTNIRRYVGNNPNDVIDPTGLCSYTIGPSGGVVGGATFTVTVNSNGDVYATVGGGVTTAGGTIFSVQTGDAGEGYNLPVSWTTGKPVVGGGGTVDGIPVLRWITGQGPFKDVWGSTSGGIAVGVSVPGGSAMLTYTWKIGKIPNFSGCDPSSIASSLLDLTDFFLFGPNDPNLLIGPAGYGTPGFIPDSGVLPYTIDFENDGTAAAQDVVVTEQLDPNLNWSTFQLGSFGFGPINVTVPAGLTQYKTTVGYENSDGTSLNVLVTLDFNVATGLLTVTYTSLDPLTGQAPSGVFDGFLYPNDASGNGEGYVQYTIQPNVVVGNTSINQQAAVVFDINPPLDTSTVTNTLDVIPPTSTVATLPADSTPTFTVNWGGTDANGPGIASYSVFVSVNGGTFTPWQTATTATSASYPGTSGDSYAFYSVATDELGLVQPTPSSGQASTSVVSYSLAKSKVKLVSGTVASGTPTTVTLQAEDANGNDLTSGGLTVTFALGTGTGTGTFGQVTDNGNGTYSATFTGVLAGANTVTATIEGQAVTSSPPTITVTPGAASPAKSVVSVGEGAIQLGGETTVTLQAVDAAGNLETSGGLTIGFATSGTGQGTFGLVTDNGNGTYSATFTGTGDGQVEISANFDNATVVSTGSVTVSGAAVSTSKSKLLLSSATDASGSGITVTLQAEDAKGNLETRGGLTVLFALGSMKGGQGTFGPVTDNDNGTYSATFTGSLAGSNTITATIDGKKVTAKAPTEKVTAGSPSLTKSLVTLSASTVKAGSKITITFQPEDAAGNKIVQKGLPVDFTLGSGTGQGDLGTMKYNANGTYTIAFTGTTAGTNTIGVMFNGQLVASTPTVTVLPGPASTKMSFVSVSSTTMTVGQQITVTLQAIDAYGNDLTTGGLAISFKMGFDNMMGDGRGTFTKVIDNHNGTYTTTMTATMAGPLEIEAEIAGKMVDSLPLIIVQ